MEEAKIKLDDIKKLSFYRDPQAIGTTEYHKISLFPKDFVATDGAKEMCEKLECFWLSDVFGSYLPGIKKDDFITGVCVVDVIEESCDVIMYDGGEKLLASQHIEFTTLKKNVKVFISRSEKYWVMMLPSEY